jgi:hypothetical protein
MVRGPATFLESQCFMPSRECSDFTTVPMRFVVEIAGSAGELIAGQLQPVKIAENRNRN